MERALHHLSSRRYHMSNMDCADCANRVESALCRLPGVSSVKVNLTSQTVDLTLDEAGTPAARVERVLADLGYPAQLQEASGVS
jgi:Cd2+/Zn2+-exporting ATPase